MGSRQESPRGGGGGSQGCTSGGGVEMHPQPKTGERQRRRGATPPGPRRAPTCRGEVAWTAPSATAAAVVARRDKRRRAGSVAGINPQPNFHATKTTWGPKCEGKQVRGSYVRVPRGPPAPVVSCYLKIKPDFFRRCTMARKVRMDMLTRTTQVAIGGQCIPRRPHALGTTQPPALASAAPPPSPHSRPFQPYVYACTHP